MLASFGVEREARLRAISHRFGEREQDTGWDLMLILGLLGCLLAVVFLVTRWQQRRSKSTGLQPMALYRRVQRKLGLALPDRWRLWWLARVLRVSHPTALLISAQMYDEAVQRYCSGWGWLGTRQRAAPQLGAIRRRLFPSHGEA